MTTPSITIRPAYADDQLALQRLAALDSADSVPPTPVLVAELDGELRVALSLHDGTVIADPFFRTASTVALIRQHAKYLKSAHSRRVGDSLVPWRRGRRGLAGLEGAGVPST